MSIKVVEAIGNESGGSHGGIKGDQTGNEIVLRTFKKRSYSFTQCLRCKDMLKAMDAVLCAKRIANCAKFGYDQGDRWSGAKAIEKVGSCNLEQAEASDFDCSSLVIECYRLAGVPLKMTGYTGSMYKILKDTGMFEDVDLSDVEYAQAGDIMIAPSKHTLIVVSDGDKVPFKDDDDDQSVEYTKVVRVKGDNVRIRAGAGTSYATTRIAHKGDLYDLWDIDEATGWYEVRHGFITNKPKYTELIEVYQR